MFSTRLIIKLLRVSILYMYFCPVFEGISQVYLAEGFESGAKPEGWTEEFISGTEPWRYRNGGHSPNDNNWLVPPSQLDITRNPPSAFEGSYNAIFFKQGDDNERTMLVTPELNLLGGADTELSFYLCQIPWTFEGSTGWDVLRVYYKVSQTSTWILLHEYLDPLYSWTLQTLPLPDVSSTYYIGFEGQTRWGYGTCIDNITVESKGLREYWIRDIGFRQGFPEAVPSGSSDVPVMRIDFTLLGNSGSAVLEQIRFHSKNTSDEDIKQNGVKLYSTTSQTFSAENPVGAPASFISHVADFTGLNYTLPPGQSYLWLTCDINAEAAYGNIIDVTIDAGDILANDTLYPAVETSPEGYRVVHSTQYHENFESTHNWTLTGEFEVNAPSGGGGSPGNPDPVSAFSGSKILGTDLTGLGSCLYNYENDLGESTSYMASSPVSDLLYYKNINLFFRRYFNIEVWDNASIQVSGDNGISWNTIWENTSYINDFQWVEQQIPIPESYWRTGGFRIRFQLGPTDAQNNYSGLNIDDIYITGEFITKDAGVSEWIHPLSGPGHTSGDSVTIRITNFGGTEITGPVPVTFSPDGGQTWVSENMYQTIPSGGSVIFTFESLADFSVPGPRSLIARTVLPGDQSPDNDEISVPVYIVPTCELPYTENFELNDGFWRSGGNEIWEHGMPAGSIINSAASGTKSWVTSLNSTYEDIITKKNMIIFRDDFESDLGWTYSGEFERNIPDYGHLPYFSFSGYYCMGTDLSGKGDSPYQYENGISPLNAYTSVSPIINTSGFSNLTISFNSWITINEGDSISLAVSADKGSTWFELWKNAEGAVLEDGFSYREFHLPEIFNNSPDLRFRFSLFSTSESNPVAQGWAVDDFLLTGNLVNTEAAYLVSPFFDLTGSVNPVIEAKIWYDTGVNEDGVTLQYSIDNGISWNNVPDSSAYDPYWNWYTGKFVTALGTTGWSGLSNGWITVRHLLPANLVNNSSVQFRFKFSADMINNQYDGVAIDDIRIVEAPPDLGVAEILYPASACEIGPGQKFSLRLKNYGITDLDQGEPVHIGYSIVNSGHLQFAQDTVHLTRDVPSGSTIDIMMSEEFDFSMAGQYEADIYTIEADPFFYNKVSNDSIHKLIDVNKPYVELGPDISTGNPEQVILTAYSGVNGLTYLWQDGSADSVFHVSVAGRYYVRVTNSLGCTASDTIDIRQVVTDAGVGELTGPLSSCSPGMQDTIRMKIMNFGTDTLHISDTLIIAAIVNHDLLSDTLILPRQILPGDSITYLFRETYDFTPAVVYNIKIYTSLPDDDNHSNDTLKYTLYGKPEVSLGDDIVVMAPEYTLTAPPGYAGYKWQNGSTSESFIVDQQGEGQYHVTVTDEHQCTGSDSINVTLNVTDITIDSILSPADTSCISSDSILISIRLRNTGNLPVSAGQVFKLNYFFEDYAMGKDSVWLMNNFMPGDSIDFVFHEKAKVLSGKVYSFGASLSYGPDMRLQNNTMNVPVRIFSSPVITLGEDYSVVAALSHTLDAGPGYSAYLWNDGSTGNTMTINTPGINRCSIIVTDNNGCTAYDTVQVMLAVPDIAITAILNPVTSCSREIANHVTVSVKNTGNWDVDQDAVIYVTCSVNGQPAARERILLSSVFQKGSAFSYTFSKEENFSIEGDYLINAAIEYESDLLPENNMITSNLTVYKSPQTGFDYPDTLVITEPVTLSVPSGYSAYRWQDGSSGNSYEVNQPGASIYHVEVTGENGCISHDSIYVIYDSQDLGLTRILAPLTSCDTGSKTIYLEIVNNGMFTMPVNRGIKVSYSINDVLHGTETVFLGSPLKTYEKGIVFFDTGYGFPEAGNYLLTINLENADENLSNNSITGTFIIWEKPNVEIGGGSDTLNNVSFPINLDAGTGHYIFAWQDDSGNSRLQVTKEGLYWVKVTDMNGCFSYDSVYVAPGESSEFPGKIKTYPNPVSDVLHLSVRADEILNFEIWFFNFYSVLYRKNFRNIQNIEEVIDMAGYPPGLYFLKVKTGGSEQILKVIKQ